MLMLEFLMLQMDEMKTNIKVNVNKVYQSRISKMVFIYKWGSATLSVFAGSGDYNPVIGKSGPIDQNFVQNLMELE